MKTTKPQRPPFAAALAALRRQFSPDPIVVDPKLPVCELCGAGGVAWTLYDRWDALTHNCDCAIEAPIQYMNGLRRTWARRNAEPMFLASLPARYRDYTKDGLNRTAHNAKGFDLITHDLTGNLYLYGPAGTGKTHIAVAAALHLAQAGKTARFWSAVDLVAALRESAGGQAPRPELDHWDVLIIDDIDKSRSSAFVYESLFGIIESRWANKKITIFTSQFNPDETARMITPDANERMADPFASRMNSGARVKIGGTDQRGGA